MLCPFTVKLINAWLTLISVETWPKFGEPQLLFKKKINNDEILALPNIPSPIL